PRHLCNTTQRALTRQPRRPYSRGGDPAAPPLDACAMERAAMQTATRPLSRGERAPDFVLAGPDGRLTRSHAHRGGRPTALLFCAAAEGDPRRHFAEALTDGADHPIALFAVQRATPAMPPPVVPGRVRPCLVFADPQGTVRTAYCPGAPDTPRLFVLDPNLPVLASRVLQDARATAHQ